MFSLSRLRRPVLLATVALLAAAPFAAASAAEWVVDPAKSTLAFSATQTGNAFEGKFGKWSGTIDFDPANPAAGHAAITIDVASAATGDTQKDEALPQPDWFDATKFPNACSRLKSFKAKGGDRIRRRRYADDPRQVPRRGPAGEDRHLRRHRPCDRQRQARAHRLRRWPGLLVGRPICRLDVEVKIDVTATRKN